MTLIRQHPLLHADLTNLGVTSSSLDTAAEHISTQLGGSTENNLCFVFSALNGREFVHSINVPELALHSGISPSVAQSMVLMLAPWIDKFQVGML